MPLPSWGLCFRICSPGPFFVPQSKSSCDAKRAVPHQRTVGILQVPLARMPTVIDKGDFCTGFSDDDGGGGCSGNVEGGGDKHNNLRSLKTPTVLGLSVQHMPRMETGGGGNFLS